MSSQSILVKQYKADMAGNPIRQLNLTLSYTPQVDSATDDPPPLPNQGCTHLRVCFHTQEASAIIVREYVLLWVGLLKWQPDRHINRTPCISKQLYHSLTVTAQIRVWVGCSGR